MFGSSAFDFRAKKVIAIKRFLCLTTIICEDSAYKLFLDKKSHEALVSEYKAYLDSINEVGYKEVFFSMPTEQVFSIERINGSTVIGYYDTNGQVKEWFLPIDLTQHNMLTKKYKS